MNKTCLALQVVLFIQCMWVCCVPKTLVSNASAGWGWGRRGGGHAGWTPHTYGQTQCPLDTTHVWTDSVRWTPHTYGQTVSAGHHTRMDRPCPLDTTHVWTVSAGRGVRWTSHAHTYGQCPLDTIHVWTDSVRWTSHTHITHTHTYHIHMDSVRWTPHTYGQTLSAGHHTRMDRHCPLDTTHVWTDIVRLTLHTYIWTVSAGHHIRRDRHCPLNISHTYGQTVSSASPSFAAVSVGSGFCPSGWPGREARSAWSVHMTQHCPSYTGGWRRGHGQRRWLNSICRSDDKACVESTFVQLPITRQHEPWPHYQLSAIH